MKSRYLIIPASFLFGLTVASCGGDESRSSKVEIEQVATKPVVINSNFTIDPTSDDSDSGDEVEITGPWFPVRFVGSNPTDRTLTIASFVVKVTGRGEDGSYTTVNWVPDLSGLTPPGIILTVPAGEVFEDIRTAYVDGLPNGGSKRYRVEMTFQGWFNKLDDLETDIDESSQPSESFEKTIRFNTQ